MKNRTLSILLTLLIVMSCFSTHVVGAESAPSYVISEKTAKAGEIFTIDVGITDNPGIISLRFKIVYDTSALELLDVKNSELLNGYTTPSPDISSPYTMRWADSLTTSDNTASGTVATLTFKLLDDTADTKVTIEHEESRNAVGQKISFEGTCANVTVKETEAADHSERFTDVSATSWAKPGIDYVVSRGYMNGTGTGTTFSPTGTMSRSMIVTVLYRIAGQPGHSGNNPFKDIEAGWYYDAVIWAYENGIVTGTSAITFAPSGDVTREQMATFLYRFASYMGYSTDSKADLNTFPDEGKVGAWAYDALAWANANGLITGSVISGETCLNPQGAATREQVATILMRFCKAYEK